MQENWAAEHLQVIRTLMERSAIYRRALAPLMTFAGVIGTVAAILGWKLHLDEPHAFVAYWAAVSVVVLIGVFLLVRRQDIRAGEVVWSPPTRRVSQALLPGLVFGAAMGALVWLRGETVLLPSIWASIYGCALHAAGFFMPRGMRLLGWCFVAAGALLTLGIASDRIQWAHPHLVMGFFFGLMHLAYGIYLYFTEKRRVSA